MPNWPLDSRRSLRRERDSGPVHAAAPHTVRSNSRVSSRSNAHAARLVRSDTSRIHAPPVPTLMPKTTEMRGSTGSVSSTSTCTSGSEDDERPTPVSTAAMAMAMPTFRRSRATNQHHSNSNISSSSHTAGFDDPRAAAGRYRTGSDNSIPVPRNQRAALSLSTDGISRSSFGDRHTDMTDGEIIAMAPPLPPAPYPVDPYHFYCRQQDPDVTANATATATANLNAHASATTALVLDLFQILRDCDIEYSFCLDKCKFKCVKYVHYSHVEFVIRVYLSNGALLLELQRRRGSVLVWDGLYSLLYHHLSHWVDATAAPCLQSGTQKKVAARDAESLNVAGWKSLAPSPPTMTSGIEAMKLMVSGPFVDAQREGCSGLAVITEDLDSAFQVARHDLVGHLVCCAASKDVAMARAAIGALGNIARALQSFPDARVAAQTRAHLQRAVRIIVGMLAQRSAGPTAPSFVLELLRECARALCSLGKVCPRDIIVCAGMLPLRLHANHRDVQLASLCRSALHELETRSEMLHS